MTKRYPPKLALMLLERLIPDSDPLVGDLVEQFGQRPSPAWFWWQTVAALWTARSRPTDGIRPLRLVELQPSEAVERSPARSRHFDLVNLTASPLRGVGGLGLVVFGVIVTLSAPAAWWVVLAAMCTGVGLGIVLIAIRRNAVGGGLLPTITILVLAAPAPGQTELRPAVPIDPTEGILQAFRSYDVVALGGVKDNDQGHAFLLFLIRDPRFAAVANDIVVECGNARYQELIDRFVNGDDLPYESLRQVWQNTTQPTAVCDNPTHEELYRTVRSVNAALPREHRLRVLLGDPPIDWATVRGKEEHDRWLGMRDSYPANLIKQEVLAKRRRALVTYGQMHFQRQNLFSNYDMSNPLAPTIVSLLERDGKVTVFSIWGNTHADMERLQADVRFWPKPSLALLKGTALGAEDFTFFYPLATNRLVTRNGQLVAIPKEDWRQKRMEEQFDAVLYLGSRSDLTRPQLSPASATILST
jgi:hypothetical protein